MNTERKIALLAAAYVAGIVLCFGPATLQSERASAAQRAQCMAEREGDQEGRKWCALTPSSATDGLPKALFWPLWLSYTAATHLAG